MFLQINSALQGLTIQQCSNDILMVFAGGIKRVPAKFQDNGSIIDKLINEIHAVQILLFRGTLILRVDALRDSLFSGISMVTCHWQSL